MRTFYSAYWQKGNHIKIVNLSLHMPFLKAYLLSLYWFYSVKYENPLAGKELHYFNMGNYKCHLSSLGSNVPNTGDYSMPCFYAKLRNFNN